MNAGPREMWALRRRLLNQLDQKTGVEKRILRRTVAEIERRLRGGTTRGMPDGAPRRPRVGPASASPSRRER